jgi:hypothetical protein
MLDFPIKQKIISDWLPILENIHATKNYVALYDIIPAIQDIFYNSDYSENYHEIANNLAQDPSVEEFKYLLGLSSEKMEILAKQHIMSRYNNASDKEKINLIYYFACDHASFDSDVILRFERIRSLRNEALLTNINSNSNTLIIGAGAVSASALYYAAEGSHVYIIDRDPNAISTFSEFINFFPENIQRNITILPTVNGEDFNYDSLSLTHILIAGLANPKNKILKKIKDSYTNSLNAPCILMRIPQNNFLHHFYYDVNQENLNDYNVTETINEHVRGSLITKVLQLKSL